MLHTFHFLYLALTHHRFDRSIRGESQINLLEYVDLHKNENIIESLLIAPVLCLFARVNGDVRVYVQLLTYFRNRYPGYDVINIRDYDQRTPLHLACCGANLDLVSYLLAKGAHVNEVDCHGRTPLYECIFVPDSKSSQAKDLIKLLKSYGAVLIPVYSTTVISEFYNYIKQNNVWMVQKFLDSSDSTSTRMLVDHADYDSRTPLHIAVSHATPMMVELLCSHGASVDKVDRWGNSPLDEAIKDGKTEIRKILFSFQDVSVHRLLMMGRNKSRSVLGINRLGTNNNNKESVLHPPLT
jgi:ankyrin repeat protein